MNKTKWIIFALVVVAIFGGIIWLNKSTPKQNYNGDAGKPITTGDIADHIYGNKDAKVVFVEYGDYQCPACGAMYQPVKDLVEKHKDKVAFIFRHYPLTNIHPNALAAATAAEAAGLQGKYWEMHDKLYENQDAWSEVSVDKREAVFAGYASDLGLNADQFKSDLTSQKIADKISRDRGIGKDTYKIGSTPSFTVNGELITGEDAVKQDLLTQKLEDAIKAAYPDAK